MVVVTAVVAAAIVAVVGVGVGVEAGVGAGAALTGVGTTFHRERAIPVTGSTACRLGTWGPRFWADPRFRCVRAPSGSAACTERPRALVSLWCRRLHGPCGAPGVLPAPVPSRPTIPPRPLRKCV